MTNLVKEILIKTVVTIISAGIIFIITKIFNMEIQIFFLGFFYIVLAIFIWVMVELRIDKIDKLTNPDYKSKFFHNEPIVNVYHKLEGIEKTLTKLIDSNHKDLNEKIIKRLKPDYNPQSGDTENIYEIVDRLTNLCANIVANLEKKEEIASGSRNRFNSGFLRKNK